MTESSTSTNNNIADESSYSVAKRNVKIVNTPSPDGCRVVPLVGIDKDGCILLYIGNIDKVLCNSAIRGKKVYILSISGNYYEGKSFWLNAVATDLDAMCKSGIPMGQLCQQPPEQWIQHLVESEPTFDFHGNRAAAAQSHTSGILITTEPFILRQADGSEVAVFLMDTQGQSDGTALASIVQQLSFFISSVQIVNVTKTLTADCMDRLLSILNRCKTTTAVNATGNKEFQSLIFLVRDKSAKGRESCDLHGGKEFFDAQIDKWPLLRNTLGKMFDQPVRCALMAAPSEDIREAEDKDDLRKMLVDNLPKLARENAPFIRSYYALFAELFDNGKLVAKRIDGEECTAEQLGDHIKFYFGLIANGTLQAAKSLFELEQEARRREEELRRKEEEKAEMENKHKEELRRLEEQHKAERRDDIVRLLTAALNFSANMAMRH